ncbi:hypothetical protein ACWEKT_15255 [Nocardia takedensis]
MTETELTLNPALLADLRSVLDYAEIGEQRDYDDCDPHARAHHILHPIRRLNGWLGGAPAAPMSFVYIQQGDTSTEFYLYTGDTAADAEAARRDCAGPGGGGYASTAVVAIPALSSAQLDAVEHLIQQLATLTHAAGAGELHPAA